MKKSIYGGLLLVALSTVGCTKETGILPTDPVENRETVVLSLDAPATRTSLSEDRKITWTSGDAINVNGINYIVEVNEQTGAATVEVIKADAYTAVFPASRFDAATSTLTLPENQTYDHQANFGSDANPMVAYSTANSLRFQSICGVVKLTVVNDNPTLVTLQQIALSDNDGGNVAGAFTLSGIETGTPTLSGGDKTSVSIQPYCDLESGASADFYIVVPSNSGNTLYQKGFTVKITSKDGDAVIRSSADNTSVKASDIVKMPAIDFVIPVQTLYYKADGATQWSETLPQSITSSLSVKTAEGSVMKSSILKEIDKLLGAAQNPIDLDFGQAEYSFETFDYKFANKNIKSISFPGNITRISTSFSGCATLEKAVIPEKVTRIGSFNSCENLAVLVCKAPTPPTMSSSALSHMGKMVPEADRKVYVPNETALQAYKAAQYWSDLANGSSPLRVKYQFLIGTGE